jgi:hypothetical protein
MGFIMQRVGPLLCNDHEINTYARTVSRQRLGKHIPAATDTNAAIDVGWKRGFLLSPCLRVINGTSLELSLVISRLWKPRIRDSKVQS